jgi:predicted small secreted protein
MRHFALLIPVLGLGCLAHAGCDDTARAVKKEAAEAAASTERAADDAKREVEQQAAQAKRDLSDAGSRLKREAEHAADQVKQAVDDTDKAVADKIRGEDSTDAKDSKK